MADFKFLERQYLGLNKMSLSRRIVLALFCFIAFYWRENHEKSGELFFFLGVAILMISAMLRQAFTGSMPLPIMYASSAFRRCRFLLSCSEYIATVRIPNSAHARNTLIAISPINVRDILNLTQSQKQYNYRVLQQSNSSNPMRLFIA